MKVERDQCDYCGKITKCYYDEKGWIILDLNSLTITNGRDEDRDAKTYYRTYSASKPIMFCCMNHLLSYLEDMTKKEKKR